MSAWQILVSSSKRCQRLPSLKQRLQIPLIYSNFSALGSSRHSASSTAMQVAIIIFVDNQNQNFKANFFVDDQYVQTEK